MAKTYIIGEESLSDFSHTINAELIIADQNLDSDRKCHDFIISSLTDKIDVLIFDSFLGENLCLRLAEHVRLSLSELGVSSLCPMVFLTSLSTQTFLNQSESPEFYFTDGVYITDYTAVQKELYLYKPLKLKNFKNGFVSRIRINAPAEYSGHDLANEWGASVMYRITTGGNIADYQYPEFELLSKSLYIKYILALTCDIQTLIFKKKRVGHVYDSYIEADGRKILLIDDCSNKGWENTLKELFVNAEEFTTVSQSVTDFEEYDSATQNLIASGNYDLVLLDLRLGGDEEEDIYETEAFSGMKILKRIKEINRGIQVIMFTASNKAWNFKALLNPDAGANGYYIKESPEYKFPEHFSEKNVQSFKYDVLRCFKRLYLKRFYSFLKDVRGDLEKIRMTSNKTSNCIQQFMEELVPQLELSYNLCDVANSSDMFKYAFLSLYQTFEIFTSHFTSEDRELKEIYTVLGYKKKRMNDLVLRNISYSFSNKNKEQQYGQFIRIAAIYLSLLKKEDNGMLRMMRNFVTIRNGFIHPTPYSNPEKTVNEKMIFTYNEFSHDKNFCARHEVSSILYRMAQKGLVYDYKGLLSFTPDVISDYEGIELLLECCMELYYSFQCKLLTIC